MATPNPNTITSARRGKRSGIRWTLLVLSIGLFIILLCYSSTNKVTQQQLFRIAPTTTKEAVSFQFEALQQEEVFRGTLKECLPQKNDHCKQYIPPGTTDQRIALLSPPGELATFLETLVKEHALHSDLNGIHLISTTHIPPYGYGKTHGWTKLIRLVPTPLVLGAVDALQAVTSSSQPQQVESSDLMASLRQVVRWHCRISHISAHTSILTLSLDQILEDPSRAVQSVVSFVRTTPDKKQLQPVEVSLSTQGSIRQQLKALELKTASFAAHWMKEDGASKLFDDVLSKELTSSKNLSVWPCPSLWSTADNGEALSPNSLPAQLAKKLVPDCDDSFADCWVDRDKCEFRGDAECKKQ